MLVWLPPRQTASTVVEEVGQTGGLEQCDADGDVPGPLGDLAPDRPGPGFCDSSSRGLTTPRNLHDDRSQ